MRALHFLFLAALIFAGPAGLAAPKKRSAAQCTFEHELELIWLRLPQPLSEVTGVGDLIPQSIRQINPRARATEVRFGISGTKLVEKRNVSLYQGESNPLPDTLKLKIPAAAAAVNFFIEVQEGREMLMASRISLNLDAKILQASRKQFLGSAITEKYDLKRNPGLFPVRVDTKGINYLYQGIHDGGLAVVLVHRKVKDPACMMVPTLKEASPTVWNDVQPFGGDLNLTALDLDFCTGALIADRIVLTAAHCLENRKPVYAGWNLKDRIEVEDVWVSDETHDRLLGIEIVHDIALLYLKKSMPAQVNITPLAQPGQVFEKYIRLGYGQRADSRGYTDLKKPKILKINEVELYRQSEEASGKIKFSQTPEEPTCRGDSGGPTIGLVDGQWYLVGVTSKVKNNFRSKVRGIKYAVLGKEKPQYCGDYYVAERVSENLELIAKGIQVLRDRNQSGE